MRVPPYYVFRPTQLIRRRVARARAARARDAGETSQWDATSPWGLPLCVDLRDAVGEGIATNGVWDLVVTETVARLLDPGETAVDVGANIGYITGVMAQTVGRSGRVVAFEPHPAVFESLVRHCSEWTRDQDVLPIELVQAALSESVRTGYLAWHEDFVSNQGGASLSAPRVGNSVEVPVLRLDEAFAEGGVDLVKVDVEGHEYEVLKGGERLLSRQQIRDVIYEDHDLYPTRVSALLEGWGYRVFALRERLLGVRLANAEAPRRRGYDPSFLATAAPDRAERRLKGLGWRTLRSGGRRPRTIADRPRRWRDC